jgi:hypothetical protein
MHNCVIVLAPAKKIDFRLNFGAKSRKVKKI